MSHFAVVVVGNDIEAALAPYEESPEHGSPFLVFDDNTDDVRSKWALLSADEQEEYGGDVVKYADDYHGYDAREVGGVLTFGRMRNPNARWDWYEVGGRYSNRFLPTRDGCVNIATASALFWDGARDTAESTARIAFARWQSALDAHKDVPRPLGWTAIREAHGNDIDGARLAYAAQPAIRSWREGQNMIDIYDISPVDDYGFDVEAYVASRRRNACVPFAYVLDGEWTARAEMGWWGHTSNDVDRDAWCTQWEAMIAALPGDARLTLVDCHI